MEYVQRTQTQGLATNVCYYVTMDLAGGTICYIQFSSITYSLTFFGYRSQSVAHAKRSAASGAKRYQFPNCFSTKIPDIILSDN